MIIALSGKKQAGKNSVCNYILGQYLCNTGLIERFEISEFGDLLVPQVEEGHQFIPNAHIYSFADQLKAMCVQVFNLTPEQVYGTDRDKNTLTKIKWEDIPLYTNADLNESWKEAESEGDASLKDTILEHIQKYIDKSGYMTAREFMQVLGSDVCRKIYGPVWIEACMRDIKRDNLPLALICDCRFPNEVDAIHQENGYIIRLSRNPFPSDHYSETALDSHQFSLNIDNAQMDIPAQNEAAYQLLKGIIW